LGARANLSMLPSCVHATLCDSNVSYRFFIGTAGLDADTAAFLQAEANNFGDLALMPRLSETYAGLTTKLLDSLAFADEHFGRFDYLLKVSAFAPRSGHFIVGNCLCCPAAASDTHLTADPGVPCLAPDMCRWTTTPLCALTKLSPSCAVWRIIGEVGRVGHGCGVHSHPHRQVMPAVTHKFAFIICHRAVGCTGATLTGGRLSESTGNGRRRYYVVGRMLAQLHYAVQSFPHVCDCGSRPAGYGVIWWCPRCLTPPLLCDAAATGAAPQRWMLSDTYLPYAMGGGYVIAGSLARFVVRNRELLSLYNAEVCAAV